MHVTWPAVLLLCWLIVAISESTELVAAPEGALDDNARLPTAGDDFLPAPASTDTVADIARRLGTEGAVGMLEPAEGPARSRSHEDADSGSGSGSGSSPDPPPGDGATLAAFRDESVAHDPQDSESAASPPGGRDDASTTVAAASDRATAAAAGDAQPPADEPAAAERSTDGPSAATEATGLEASSSTDLPAVEQPPSAEAAASSGIGVRPAEAATPTAAFAKRVAASLRRWPHERCRAMRSLPWPGAALSRVAASVRPVLRRGVAAATSLVAQARRHRALLGGLAALALFAHRAALLLRH